MHKRTRLRWNWPEIAAVLTVSALLSAFLWWGAHQIPDTPSSGVVGAVEGAR